MKKNFKHPKIKYITISGIGDAERDSLVEKRLQDAQTKKKFKDAGTRVKGSKKEKAAIRGLITVSDLPALEQDEITAFEMVVKDKVWAKLDTEQEKLNGVEPGAVFLKKELRSAYAGKPTRKIAAMRKSYVVVAAYFQNEFSKIKTVNELRDFKEKFYKISMMEAVKVYLPDEAYLFENPERAVELKKMFNEWQTRQLLKEVAGKEFYNLLFIYNSDAAWQKWKKAIHFTEDNDWSWAEKKSVERGQQSELTINTGKPLAYIKRTGGLVITDLSEKFIIDTLGFSYLEFGNYVRDNEANEHLRHFIGSYVDLCDVLNIDAKQITKLNNLSIAFGSRGKRGAMAFYQSSRQIIALTKQRGDGTVAHEWFHYLDHLIYKNISPDNSRSMEHPLFSGSRMAITNNKFVKLKVAFENIKKYIQQGDYFIVTGWHNETTPILQRVPVKKDAVTNTISETYKSQAVYKYRIDLKGTFEETLQALKDRYPSYFTQSRFRSDATKKIIGFIANHFKLETVRVEIENQITSSLYYYYSSLMKSKYWIEPVELFARAFETYMFDKLASQNRFNNYLVNDDSFDCRVYPFGTDRETLFKLYDILFEELKTALNLEPFKQFTDTRADEYINFDVKKETETVSSGVIVEHTENTSKTKAKALALEIELELINL